MSDTKRYNVALVGCGGVSEILHLPVLTKLPQVEITALVDRNLKRAHEMASKFCLNGVYEKYDNLYDETDVALVALPNHLHAKVTSDFLKNDVNVLCEKPMATSVDECTDMIKACEKSKGKLMIGHQKRFMSNMVLGKRLVDLGNLGTITGYNCKAGAKFRWPTQSGFYFKKGEAGGGVLIDLGVHMIDLILWFFGEVANLQYKGEDTMGKGIEDNVFIRFDHKNSVKGEFTLSRTQYLDNTLTIHGTSGWAKIGVFDTTLFEFQSKRSKATKDFGKLNVKTKNNNAYRDQFVHFLDCIKTDKEPLISGSQGRDVITIVEECYRQQI